MFREIVEGTEVFFHELQDLVYGKEVRVDAEAHLGEEVFAASVAAEEVADYLRGLRYGDDDGRPRDGEARDGDGEFGHLV